MWELYRLMLEAQDDTGQAAEPPSPPNFGSEPDGAELILNAIRDANAEEPDEEPDEDIDDDASDTDSGDVGRGGTPRTAGPVSGQPGDEGLILGRFRTNEDVIQAYQNLEPAYTQTSQQLRDLERTVQELQSRLEQPAQEDFHFDSGGLFNVNPTSIDELEALAEEHPDQAAMWAVEHSDKLDPRLVQETINYWHQRNPAQATAFMVNAMFQSYMPQVDQRLAPHDERAQEEVVYSAVDMAEAAIGPQYEEYHDRIIDMIEANPQLLPDDLNNAQAMSESIINVYAMLLGHDLLQRGQQIAQGAAVEDLPNPAAQAARTATRTGAVTPTPDGEAETSQLDKQIQDMILRAR